MKKILSILMASVMSFALVGCGIDGLEEAIVNDVVSYLEDDGSSDATILTEEAAQQTSAVDDATEEAEQTNAAIEATTQATTTQATTTIPTRPISARCPPTICSRSSPAFWKIPPSPWWICSTPLIKNEPGSKSRVFVVFSASL